MNEIELVRELRADLPVAGPAELAAPRERLLAVIADGDAPRRRSSRQPRRSRRRSLALAGAVAAALVLVAVNGASSPRLSYAAEVLRGAARARMVAIAPQPAAHQWLFVTSALQNLRYRPQTQSVWQRFDGARVAYRRHGRVVVGSVRLAPASRDPLARFNRGGNSPQIAYDALAALPADPRTLLARVDVVSRTASPPLVMPPSQTGPLGRADREFGYIASLLMQGATVSETTASAHVFQALSLIPGVTAHRAVTDALGRPAIALQSPGGSIELLLAPDSYALRGERFLQNAVGPNWFGHRPIGTVLQSIAVQSKWVAGPGDTGTASGQ